MEIFKQLTTSRTQFSFLVRIENFPSFVTLKASFDTKQIDVYGTKWFIGIDLHKCGKTSKEDILVTSSSTDQPEFLGAFVCGTRFDRKECSFDVHSTFKFKRPTSAQENRESHKFCFNSTKQNASWGYRKLARIDVILDLLFVVIPFTINFRIFWTFAMAI